MAVRYKVWMQVERQDENKDEYENITEEADIAVFDGPGARQRALKFANTLEFKLGDLIDLGTSDIYTDAHEYADRVKEIRELFAILARRD